MYTFAYQYHYNGAWVSGTINADTQKEALDKILSEGIKIISIVKVN